MSIVLGMILLMLGGFYLVLMAFTGRQFFQEANQRLYGHIADSTVAAVKPLVNGRVDTTAVQDIMHSTMVMNPSAEVYLLDTTGRIITYVAPRGKIKMQRISLGPVQHFLQRSNGDPLLIMGDDPRHPERANVFSAAPIYEAGVLQGYLYIVLASEQHAAIMQPLLESYILRVAAGWFFLALVVALVAGSLSFRLITRRLDRLGTVVRAFHEGDLAARVPTGPNDDLAPLALAFNEMADTIVNNLNELKSVETLRRELVANVSHDLRTPLAVVLGYVETLQMKAEVSTLAERQHFLAIALESLHKLSRLIDQLFEYAKLEANQIQSHKEAFAIDDLIQDIVAQYRLLAERQGLKLRWEAPPAVPLVFADISLVERVIQNLLDNALKFTPQGGLVTVSLHVRDTGVEVQVSDTGVGIPEHEQALVFERYRQGSFGKSQAQGAGLGLAIVKKILEIHSASLHLRSTPNCGSTFGFLLPLSPVLKPG